MCHGGGMAGERLGTAEADRQLEYLQGIEESERLLLAAFDVEGEGRARPRALPCIDRLCWRAILQERQVVHLADLGMIAEKLGDTPGIRVGSLHPEPERLERAPQHPAGERIELRADAAAQHLDWPDGPLRAKGGAGDEVGVTAHILGQ